MKSWHKLCFRARERFNALVSSPLRRAWWNLQGAEIAPTARIQRLLVTWPHQIRIGEHCLLEEGTFFKFDGVWINGPRIILNERVFVGANCEFNIRKGITIGARCAIASGCKFIDHDHDISGVAEMDTIPGPEAVVALDSDVWLGTNVIVLKGVTIGRGAVVAAGAVVTRSIPALEIWAGIPARKIGDRTETGRKSASAMTVPEAEPQLENP